MGIIELISKMGPSQQRSTVLPSEVWRFGSARLRQLFEFLPSGLLLSFCEASQAAGTVKALGLQLRYGHGNQVQELSLQRASCSDNSKVCPFQQHSAVLPTEVGTFRSACLRQLFVFLPSGLLLSFCEASQAVGIRRVLGIGTRAWAWLDHSTIDPF